MFTNIVLNIKNMQEEEEGDTHRVMAKQGNILERYITLLRKRGFISVDSQR